jgi:hypothetical protein
MKAFLLGLVFMGVGGAMMYYSYPLKEMFGQNAWAERNLGGTRNLFLMIGFVLIIVGGLMMFGIVQVANPTESLPEGIT